MIKLEKTLKITPFLNNDKFHIPNLSVTTHLPFLWTALMMKEPVTGWFFYTFVFHTFLTNIHSLTVQGVSIFFLDF